MKRIFTISALLMFTACIFAQAPGKLSYQAIVRNPGGDLIKSSNVGMRLQILQGSEFGAAVYVETHTASTNENGLATIEIGGGTPVTGQFDNIDWETGPYFIKTEIDLTGGTNYTISGTSQMLSVPYALYSKSTSLPENIVKPALPPSAGDILYFDGTNWKTLTIGTEGQVLTVENGLPAWKDVLTGNELTALHDPILRTIFNDDPGNHNMHITTDGNYYYTCNGGNYTTGKINMYTMNGDFVASFPIAIDMRGIMYNKSDGLFYVSGFEGNTSERNLYQITNMQTGTFVKLYPNLYDYNQACVAMSDDGQYLYAFNKGTLKQYKLSDGSLADTITGLNYGTSSGADGAVAVDPDYIYTWDGSTGTVYVYDHEGTFVKSLTLSNGNYGFSLSYLNGYLFVSKDGNYSVGTWYGYNIRRNLTKSTAVIKNDEVISRDVNRIADPNDTSIK